MAGYAFETMSASDAAAFTTNDTLFFTTSGSTANMVQVAPFNNGSSGNGANSGTTLSYAGKMLTFPGGAISTASLAGRIQFSDNSHLLIGVNGTGDTINPINATDAHTVYGLGGNDTINFGTAGAGVAEYLNGGFGADTINGGSANNHIYGNSQFAGQGATDPTSGAVDGGDTITVLGGSNYINGNAGDDTITAGTNATANTNTSGASNAAPATNGYNRIFGGANADTINIAGAGHNAVNGNTGNDRITDTGNGDNTLRGGQGDDTITGGSGHSVLMGDAGNDVIIIHGNQNENQSSGASNTFNTAHINVITGGEGADTFNFSQAGAGQAAKFGQVTYYQEITDFTHAVDKMILPTTAGMSSGNGSGAVVGTSTTVFGSVHDAEAYALTVLSGNGVAGATPNVAALSVGTSNNTYVMYLDNTTAPTGTNEVSGLGVVHLSNVTATTLTSTDFITT